MSKMRFKTIRSFTLVELMVVVGVIAVLAGLVLGGAGAVRQRAARGQAKVEISAIEAGLARYHQDFGSYPVATSITTNAAVYFPNTTLYYAAGQILFTNLWGASTYATTTGTLRKPYLDIPPKMAGTDRTPNYLIDPWGIPYGYFWNGTNSLYAVAAPDIWSTGGQSGATTAQRNTNKWITSWD